MASEPLRPVELWVARTGEGLAHENAIVDRFFIEVVDQDGMRLDDVPYAIHQGDVRDEGTIVGGFAPLLRASPHEPFGKKRRGERQQQAYRREDPRQPREDVTAELSSWAHDEQD